MRCLLALLLCLPVFAQTEATRCQSLRDLRLPRVELTETTWTAATATLPAHCLVRGAIEKRTGFAGKTYYIGFELRLPDAWQGRFLFQGGGGMDGLVRPAIAPMNGTAPALARGFATVSTDAGHQGAPPDPASDATFAQDQQARIDNAYRSIGRVAEVSKALIEARYGRNPDHTYFAGCSNGGRQGLMAAQRFPLEFDGIISGAPAFRVTHAAIGSAWETIAFTNIAPKDADGKPILSQAFSNDDLKLVADRILTQCDALDGAKDGLVFNTKACKFDPAQLLCRGAKAAACLSEQQVQALHKVFAGPTNSRGEAIYSDWPWDPGLASPEWRMLKLGTSPTAKPNSIDYRLMLEGLKGYFFYPPAPNFNPLKFDFDKDPARVADTANLQDPTSTHYSTFTQHGGKLLLYHGMADPFFSANDTARYYESLDADKANWASLFLVPGMAHCGGGPSLDTFDSLTAIVDWVEKGKAPQSLEARGKAFPNVTRPLCAYPKYAAYSGAGDPAKAESYICR